MMEEKNLIDAWDKIGGDHNFSPREIESWLINDMAPAIKELKNKYNYGIRTKHSKNCLCDYCCNVRLIKQRKNKS